MRSITIYFLAIPFFLILSLSGYAQVQADTIIVSYKLVRGNSGCQAGIGIAHFWQNAMVSKWMRDYTGVDLSLVLFYKKHHLTGCFKPSGNNTQMNLEVNGQEIRSGTLLNNIKTQVSYGYDINLNKKLIAQPFLGYSVNTFTQPSDPQPMVQYNIPKARGMVIGLQVRTDIKLHIFGLFSPYISLNESFIHYDHINPGFGNSYFSAEAGFLIGGYNSKRINI